MNLLKEKTKYWRNWILLGIVALFTPSCGLLNEAGSDELDVVLGSLNLKGMTKGLSTAGSVSAGTGSSASLHLYGGYHLANETIIKVTYASLPEKKGTVDANGAWNINGLAGDKAFSMTIFSNEVPVCTYVFKSGENSAASVSFQEEETDIGESKCVDGHAEVDTANLDNLSDGYIDKVKGGAVDQEILDILTTGEGLQVIVNSKFDEFSGTGFKQNVGGAANPPAANPPAALSLQNPPNDPGGQPGGDGYNDPAGQPGGQPGGQPNDNQHHQDMGPKDMGRYGGINPKLCTQVGYNVPDSFFDASVDWGDDAHLHQGPTMHVQKEEDGTYSLVVLSQNDQGTEEKEVFKEVKLGGYENNFMLSGSKKLEQQEIKNQAASDYLRRELRKMDTGIQEIGMPQWNNFECAPEVIANSIRAEMGYAKDESGFESIFDEAVQWHDTSIKGDKKQLCSELTPSDPSAVKTLDKLCKSGDDFKTDRKSVV